jgi:hypothetical protein
MTVASSGRVFHSHSPRTWNAPRAKESGDPIKQTSPAQPEEVSY